jgi:uncharacterized MAPEG superfamily protein
MTIPMWVLLGFAMWTLLTLFGSVGIYRWSLILTGRAALNAFRADRVEGADWYRRAMRAHANCVENLPVYAAIALTAHVAGLSGRVPDTLAITVLLARIAQTVTHIACTETSRAVGVRFAFFLTQAVAMVAMAVLVTIQ